MCHRTLCVGSSAPAAQPCAPWVLASVGDLKRKRWIVSVQAQFVANSGRHAVNGRAGTTINLRSREEHMWRTALGC
jgi:hypothetical protein